MSYAAAAFALVVAWHPVHALQDDDLSLEDLTKTEVSSVARRSQSLSNVPAAAFVITAEDIRRSGALALPDVLRMVPGIQVAQVDSGRYAVSARGFNGRFANKLQALIDGRSVYHPFFPEPSGNTTRFLLKTSSALKSFAAPAPPCGESMRSTA